MLYLLLLAFYRDEVVSLSPTALLIDYRFYARYLFLLKLMLLCKSFALFGFLSRISAVIAVVYSRLRMLYIEYLVCGTIEKISVMRDENKSFFV